MTETLSSKKWDTRASITDGNKVYFEEDVKEFIRKVELALCRTKKDYDKLKELAGEQLSK